MKRILGIVVLGLFWCNAGFAELIELNKCFTKKPGGVMADVVIWNSWNEFNKDVIKEYYNCTTCKKIKIDDDWHTSVTIYEGPKYEDVIYSVNTENMIVTQFHIPYCTPPYFSLAPRNMINQELFIFLII